MFKTKEKLLTKISTLEAQIESLEDSEERAREKARVAKEELFEVQHKTTMANEKLELKHKIAEEDIKHMVKMSEGRTEIEIEKGKMTAEKECNQKVEEIKATYHKKLEEVLKSQIEDAKETHHKLMEHMPKIEAMFGNQDLKKTNGDSDG